MKKKLNYKYLNIHNKLLDFLEGGPKILKLASPEIPHAK